MFRPIEVRPLPGFRLYLRYDDGAVGEVDLSDFAGHGVFALWDEPGAFERASIGSGGEIRWSDQVDLCADALYMKITGATPEQLFPQLGEESRESELNA